MGKQTESDTESEPLTPVSEDKDQSQFVYCVNEGYLPSHIRTVVIVPSDIYQHDDNTKLKHKFGICKRQKCVVLVIILVVTLIISTAVSLALWKYFDQQLQMDYLSEWTLSHKGNKSSSHISSNNITHHLKLKDHILSTKGSRVSCNKICFSYSAFRFKSKCVDGFCVCGGLGYHPLSCMPQVNECLIRKSDNEFAVSKYNHHNQNTFSCSTDTILNEEVHVLSNFGNNYKDKTIIDISDSRENERKPVVLVLVNYQKVEWTIKIKDSKTSIKKVYLFSNKNLSSSTVTVINTDSISKTEVVKYYSQTGYGDDRYGGHTVDVLQKIYKDIGSVTTFTGTSCADHWTLTLKTHYKLDT